MRNPFDNPVLSLDARSRVREKRLWILAAFFLAVPLVISLLILFSMASPDTSPFPSAGEMISGVAIFSHGALMVLLSALGAAQRISQERERRTLPALVNSPMSAVRIADGKLLGAWRFTAWLAFMTLPFLAAAAIWGGLPPSSLLAAWAFNLAAALATASLALGISGFLGRSLSAYLATGAVLFLWCAVVPAVAGIICSMAGSSNFEDLFPVFGLYHLPLAPQAILYMGGIESGGEADEMREIAAVAIPTALAVWFLIGLLGRFLAIRGLRREVY